MAILVDKNTKVVFQGFAGAEGIFYAEQAIAQGTRGIEGVADTLGRGRTMLACLLASLATSALAQPAADLATPEALAAFVMEACVYETPTPEVSEDAIQAAGFALAKRGEETVEFAAPDGSTLALGARNGTFASCELRLPDRSEAFFEALAQALSAALGERYPVADLESLEDGMMWRLEPAPELLTETELSHLENGDVLVVSATEVGRVPLGYE